MSGIDEFVLPLLPQARRHVPSAVSFKGAKLVVGKSQGQTNWLAQDHTHGLLI